MSKAIKVNQFLHRKKDKVNINPDNEYSLVTVKMHHKGVVLREKKKGSLLGSSMYRISKGQFILSGIDARNGAFGIVPEELEGAIITNDFWTFEVDENVVKRDFFYWLTNTPLFLDVCQKSSKGETQRIRLQSDLFFNFEFHFPPLEKQAEFLGTFQKIDSTLTALGQEQENQTTYLSQLRQAILQEAIEGKLTAEWRKKNLVNHEYTRIHTNNKKDISVHSSSFVVDDLDFAPASVLLEKIKAEKHVSASLITRRQKELAPIKSEDIPFELPEGWVWTRLGKISSLKSGNQYSYPISNTGLPFVKVGDMNISGNEYEIKCSTIYFYNENIKESDLINPPSIIFPKRGGAIATNKRRCVLQEPVLIDSNTMAIRLERAVNFNYFLHWFGNVDLGKLGNQSVIPQINNKDIEPLLFPLPPLGEQRAIVERVDRLLSMVDDLGKQVTERKSQAEELMQMVLREAFEG
jgi:restriction endonuclease S subunit